MNGITMYGFIAGLGLGGLAFALAAKDALANIFGGIVIIMEKPFSIGDWVQTPSVEGTVEGISFRSTRFRTFTQSLVTVPNSILANQPITNCSRMGKRRVRFTLSIDYTGPRCKIEKCLQGIRNMLKEHPGIHQETILVRLETINVNSLDVLVYYFTVATNWEEYLAVKEDVNYRIMDILATENLSLASPGRTIYTESKKAENINVTILNHND
jgi:MscS family membrane protein